MKNCKWFLYLRVKGSDWDGINDFEINTETRIPLISETEEEARKEADKLYSNDNIYNHLSEEMQNKVTKLESCAYSDFKLIYVCDPVPLGFEEKSYW